MHVMYSCIIFQCVTTQPCFVVALCTMSMMVVGVQARSKSLDKVDRNFPPNKSCHYRHPSIVRVSFVFVLQQASIVPMHDLHMPDQDDRLMTTPVPVCFANKNKNDSPESIRLKCLFWNNELQANKKRKAHQACLTRR